MRQDETGFQAGNQGNDAQVYRRDEGRHLMGRGKGFYWRPFAGDQAFFQVHAVWFKAGHRG